MVTESYNIRYKRTHKKQIRLQGQDYYKRNKVRLLQQIAEYATKHKKERKQYNKRMGILRPIRMNAETYQWSKEMQELTQNEVLAMFNLYKIKKRHEKDTRKNHILRTQIKWLYGKVYMEKSVSPDNPRYKMLAVSIPNSDNEHLFMECSSRVNWSMAESGWTDFYDDGVVTLSPLVFYDEEE